MHDTMINCLAVPTNNGQSSTYHFTHEYQNGSGALKEQVAKLELDFERVSSELLEEQKKSKDLGSDYEVCREELR